MRKIILQNHFLGEIAQVLLEGNPVRIRIDGESMHPFIVGGKDEIELVPYHRECPLELWTCVFFRWQEHYMVHRFIGCHEGRYFMMGDGNLAQIEKVREEDILGILQTIYRADGSVQNCKDKCWLRKGKYWYRFRKFRRFLLPLYRKLYLGH